MSRFSALMVGVAALAYGTADAAALRWSTPLEIGTQPSELIGAVACPAVGLCVATDAGGDVETSADPAAGGPAWGRPVHVSSQLLSSIACPSTTLCVAVGGSEMATSTDPSGPASAWSSGPVDPGHELTSVACPSSSECVAVDDVGNGFVSLDPAAGAAGWSAPTEAGPAKLASVACPSSTLCVAVGEGDVAERRCSRPRCVRAQRRHPGDEGSWWWGCRARAPASAWPWRVEGAWSQLPIRPPAGPGGAGAMCRPPPTRTAARTL